MSAHRIKNLLLIILYNWGERSETLLSDERCNSVCVCVCLSVMDRHPIFAFVTRDPYPFNFADELGVSNFAELAPHNALSILLVIIIVKAQISIE